MVDSFPRLWSKNEDEEIGVAKESQGRKKRRTQKIIRLLKRYYPDAHCALNFTSPEELIVATVLSAQCTDERVNIVTKHLFKRCPSMHTLAEVPLKELEEIIRSTGFYRNKAKNLQRMGQILFTQHRGKVPPDMDVLVHLPGVGRKTANVVMGNAFHIPTGIVVDTHVSRLSKRLGLTTQTSPEKIEKDLESLIEKKDWIMFSHWLIEHGRKVCKARKPSCETCFLLDICPQKI